MRAARYTFAAPDAATAQKAGPDYVPPIDTGALYEHLAQMPVNTIVSTIRQVAWQDPTLRRQLRGLEFEVEAMIVHVAQTLADARVVKEIIE